MPKIVSKRHYTWYVEPLDSLTNGVIWSAIGSEDNACESMPCADGKRHNLFRCDHEAITNLRRNRRQLHLRFKVFVQEGQGAIRPWSVKKNKTGKSPVFFY